MDTKRIKKMVILAIMVALDVVLSPLMRIEGMAPMSSTMNVIAGLLMGPKYTVAMAFLCGILRMMLLGIPPLALTGALFGALLAGIGGFLTRKWWGASLGEFIGTGIIGSLISYPVMVWFTQTTTGLFWFVYTPRFCGGALIGSAIALVIWSRLRQLQFIQDLQALFFLGK